LVQQYKTGSDSVAMFLHERGYNSTTNPDFHFFHSTNKHGLTGMRNIHLHYRLYCKWAKSITLT